MGQFNTIKYINGLELSDIIKKKLEIYMNSDDSENELENESGTIDINCMTLIDKKAQKLILE